MKTWIKEHWPLIVFMLVLFGISFIYSYKNKAVLMERLMQIGFARGSAVSDMPADNTFHNSDLFYSVDQGVRSRQMAGSVITGMINDTADQVRSELADTASDLRDEIGGGVGWSVSGDIVYFTSPDDSLGVGTGSPTEKLEVNGNIAADTGLYSVFDMNGLEISTSGGGTELEIVGDVDFTGEIELGTNNGVIDNTSDAYEGSIRFSGSGGGGTSQPRFDFNLPGTAGLTDLDYLDLNSVASVSHAAGAIYYDSDDNHFYGSNGSSWTQMDGGAGQGSADSSYVQIEVDSIAALNGNTINFVDSVLMGFFGLGSGDTCGVIALGATSRLDTASLYKNTADEAWIDRHPFFKLFFWKSKKMQALPLPYPDGTQRRQFNYAHHLYQAEYELERANIYINRLWNWLFVVSVGLIYLIIKTRKR